MLYGRIGDTNKATLIRSRRVELRLDWERKLPQSAFVRKQLAAALMP